jgi:hypothetical protein
MSTLITNIIIRRVSQSSKCKFLIVLTLVSFLFAQSQTNNAALTIKWIGNHNAISSLDGVIHTAPTLALNIADYNHAYLDQFTKGNTKLLNNRDSIIADSIINQIAVKFFSDLAYGNHPPNLQSTGYRFKLNTYNINELIIKHSKSNSLLKLAQYLNTNSFEVSKLLATLKVYQDSSKKNNTRIKLLVRAINDYRWLRAVSETQRVVLVNIPSAQLRVYEREKTLLAMKLILGKARTPSKTFSTLIQKITINPYWVVPSSIAINEMLPKLKRDNGYIDRNHLQVLNSNYKVINAGNINWDSYDANNFPFTIRQSTGCDNSLGIIKLEFDSPFGVYLHDTPEKSLFTYNSRFYSHGCMRMEKPIEMAKLLMQKNSLALDTIDLEACAKRPDPITINVPEQIPLIVWYNLIDFDDTGAVKFYKDVYHQFTY